MNVEITDVLIVLIRWLHAMAAALWIGAAFAALGLHAGLIGSEGHFKLIADRAYRDLTDVAIPIFLLTGAILTFDRFSRGVPGPDYVAVLSAKLVLAFGMFHLGYKLRRAGLSSSVQALRALCVLGASIVLLATMLKALSGGAPT